MSEKASKPLVYIAGPYSSNPEVCTREACNVASVLNRSGIVLAHCPHTSMLAEMISPIGYDRWLELDLELVERSDAVLRLPGESAGADREVETAKALGMPVFETTSALLMWAIEQKREKETRCSVPAGCMYFEGEPVSFTIKATDFTFTPIAEEPQGNVRALEPSDRAWLDGLWNAYHGDLPGQRPKGD